MNSSERVRIVSADPTTPSRYTFEAVKQDVPDLDPENDLNKSLNLIPYSHVTENHCQRKRPVLFWPTALAKTIVHKLLNAGGAMEFNMCKPGINAAWSQSVTGKGFDPSHVTEAPFTTASVQT
ncbi:UNVERIFIED_CONTAM: hypothetical protein FKN15_026641 [Acipenser sinensis]